MKGIDVSAHQGIINWEKVKQSGIEFAMIRAGYSTTEDKYLFANVTGCENNNIPYGLYLFSYALTPQDAIEEAEFLLNIIALKKLTPLFPIAFDLEGDTLRYMTQMKVNPTKQLINDITAAFCDRIEKAGFYCMNYTNKDFYIHWFEEPTRSKYDLWVAHWNVTEPFLKSGIWQHTSKGSVDGIQGNVDLNYSYKNYPSIIKTMNEKTPVPEIPIDWKAEHDKLIRDIEALIDLYKS